jgi:hypothetical protein
MQHNDGVSILVPPVTDVEGSPRYDDFTCFHDHNISPKVQSRSDTTIVGCIKWKAFLCQALFYMIESQGSSIRNSMLLFDFLARHA